MHGSLLLDGRIDLKYSMMFYTVVTAIGALFQLEPTMIDERYYTSGRGERRQYVGNVLPPGAEIPDSDPAPVKAAVQTIPARVAAPSAVPVKAPIAPTK